MIPTNQTSSILDDNYSGQPCTLQGDAAMFKLLTTDVYNDAILAVMREWSTNAIDACIAAGHDINFDVHIPTNNKLEFSVRDYGTGLTQEDITGLFSVIGKSTKRESNDYNGTFGIGRMAGIAYNESFTVESFYNGTKYTYLIALKDGIPTPVHLNTTLTTEANGLRLATPVKGHDLALFKEKATLLYVHFDHKPNLNLDLPIVRDTTNDLSLDFYHYVANNFQDNNYLVMANVTYPIPSTKDFRSYVFRHTYFRVPNGFIKPNPGRESFIIDQQTISAINNLLKQASVTAITEATRLLSVSDTDYNIYQKFRAISKSLPINHSLNVANFLSSKATSFIIPNCYFIRIGNSPLYPNVALKCLTYNGLYPADKKATSIDKLFTKVLLLDLKSNYYNTITAVHQDYSTVLTRPQDVDWDTFINEAYQLISDLGLPYTKASSLEAPAKKATTTTVRTGIYVCPYGKTFYASELADSSTTYWYVPLSGFTPPDDIPVAELNRVLPYLGDKVSIVGVQKKYLDQAEADPNFIPVKTVLKELKSRDPVTIPHKDLTQRLFYNYVPSNLPTDLQEAHDAYISYEDNKNKYVPVYLKDAYDVLQIPYTLLLPPHKLSTITNKYPLLKDLVTQGNREGLDHYMELHNELNQLRKDER